MFEKNCIVLRICVTDILVGISEWFCLISTSLSVLKKVREIVILEFFFLRFLMKQCFSLFYVLDL